MNKARNILKNGNENISYPVFIPANLDIIRLFNDNPVDFPVHKDNNNKWLNMAYTFLGLLTKKWVLNIKKNGFDKSDGFIRLNAGYLRDIIHQYRFLIDYLIQLGVVETDGISFDGKSLGYRLTEKYRNSLNLQAVKITDPILIKNIKSEIKRNHDKVKMEHPKLIQSFEGLHVDQKQAGIILDTIYPCAGEYPPHILSRNASNRIIASQALWKLLVPDYRRFSIGITNRLYTPLTNLKKELRESLRFTDTSNGCTNEPLIEIDLKTSIPTFFTILLQSLLVNNMHIRGELKHTLIELPFSKEIESILEEIIYRNPLLTMSEIRDYQFGKDVYRFIHDVLNGDLYETLRHHINTVLDKSLDRDTVKKKFNTVTNLPNSFKGDFRRLIKAKYPTVMGFIELLNQSFRTSSKHKDALPVFAHLTQRIEAEFVLNVAVKHLAKCFPHMPVFTIHDSLLIPAKDYKVVMNELNRLSIEQVGFELKFERKEKGFQKTDENNFTNDKSKI